MDSSDPKALDLAEKLGLAFQLTNIIRDVREDYVLGRVYLPEEDLERYGVAKADFGRKEATLGVHELLRFEAERAWKLYEEGAKLLSLIDEDSRSTLWLLVHTYSALLARIEAADFAVFGERVRLPKSEKLKLFARARFGRHTEENLLAKRDRDRRRAWRGCPRASRWLKRACAYACWNSVPFWAAAHFLRVARRRATWTIAST